MTRLKWFLAHLSALIIGVLIGIAINSVAYKLYDMIPSCKPVIIDHYQIVGRM